jgi:hypothetical protein
VRWSFSWRLRRELEETFVVAPDERRIKSGLIAVRRQFGGRAPGLLLLTDKRLCLVVHYFFRLDRGFEFPRGSFTSARRIKSVPTTLLRVPPYLRLSYQTKEGLANLDISDVQARTTSVALMGQPIKTEHLIEAVQDAWGPEAPAFLAEQPQPDPGEQGS